ncbi:hypothetical protein QTO34_004960 [Cnephaeus nilssonii]|uniref:SH3 domain-containing protein n=1 Tax=Cnephaeus nilssonii TaxID=3371016 RepID=A0AA40LIX6_CNENI|nr:hypothetical protein QTO34_004960 [Eptesicus nilssonii]
MREGAGPRCPRGRLGQQEAWRTWLSGTSCPRTRAHSQSASPDPPTGLGGAPQPEPISGPQTSLLRGHLTGPFPGPHPPPAALLPGSRDFRGGETGADAAMPSLGDQVRDWQRGVQAVERGDWGCALRLFSGFPEPPAKMCFNVGCVHLLAGDPEAALRVSQGARAGGGDSTSAGGCSPTPTPGLTYRGLTYGSGSTAQGPALPPGVTWRHPAFDQAVTKDACLAVGFFQRGVARLQVGRSQEALADFQWALAQLRGNAAIDYTQLGLRFKLQAWEVLFNVATAQCALGLWAEAARSLEDATAKAPEGARGDLSIALAQVQKQAPLQPRLVPRGEVFRPPRRHLERLERVDFLGKAKVVVASPALEARNQGVWPQRPQVRGEDGGAGPRAGPRALDTGACRADTPPRPGTPSHADLEVGSDQAGRAGPCAPGTHDEQVKSHTDHLGKQVPLGLLAAGGPDPEPSEDPTGAGGVAAGDPESWVTVTVQCAFTLALQAPRGADLPHLRALLSQALPLQAQCGQLRWHQGGAREEAGRSWEEAGRRLAHQRLRFTKSRVTGALGPPPGGGAAGGLAGGGLGPRRAAAAVPVSPRPQAAGGRPVLYQVVAQHSYSAPGPADLGLQPGDTVDVLCEVDQAWLEGHCDGRIGIFPKSFVVPVGPR